MLTAFLTVTLAIVLYYVVNVIWLMDYHLDYNKHHPGQCRRVKGVDYGAEDVHVTKDGLAFITSGLSCNASSRTYQDFIQDNKVKGHILLFDFKNPEQGAVVLKIRPTDKFDLSRFRPHGISVLEDKDTGKHILYVVNHQLSQPDKELIHMKYFTSDLFRLTNDVTAVEEDTFYVTNCLYFNESSLAMMENLLRWPLGSVVYYNGSNFETAIPQISGPNGILLSADQR